MNVRELLTKIGFEVDEKPLKEADKGLREIKDRLDLLMAAEVFKKLYELAETFAHFGEELHVAAQSAGITVEAFQKLAYAAQQSNVSQEQMQHGMALLSRRMYEARTGSDEAQKAFRKAGISPEQVKGFKTSQEALLALADRFTRMKDPIAKMGAAQELLGRGGYQMVSFLSKGSAAIRQQGDEAERLGLILSEHQVEALEEVEHAFQRLHAVLRAIGAFIASYIGPAFTFLVDKFIAFYGANKDIINLNFQEWLEKVAYAMGFVVGLVFALTQKILDLAKALHMEGKILTLVFEIAGLISALVTLGTIVKTVSFVMGFLTTGIEALLSIIGTAVAVIESPFFLLAAAIGAVIVAVHDLYALFAGKPTWLGQFSDWLKSLGMIQVALNFISDTWDKLKGGLGTMVAKAENFLGIGNEGVGNPEQRLAALSSTASAASSITNATTSVGGNSNVEVNAPVTIHVPAGTDPKEVSSKVKEGIQEHFARVSREIQRSTLNPVAH
jgi:hypothetical protein